MWTALYLLKRYPKEIESDLLPGIDIADWHRGTRDEFGMLKLSSRRLLVLLDKLPEESEYKKWSERQGDWSVTQKILQTIANESGLLRNDIRYIGHMETFDPTHWWSPGELREMQDEEQDSQELEGEMFGHLFGGL